MKHPHNDNPTPDFGPYADMCEAPYDSAVSAMRAAGLPVDTAPEPVLMLTVAAMQCSFALRSGSDDAIMRACTRTAFQLILLQLPEPYLSYALRI